MKRHKHADLIKQWLDGTDYEHRPVNRNNDFSWVDVETIDDWMKDDWEYRIKPSKPLIDEETRKAIKKLFPDANWLAMDGDGGAYLYKNKPKQHKRDKIWGWENEQHIESLRNYAPDWRTSLVDLNEEVR